MLKLHLPRSAVRLKQRELRSLSTHVQRYPENVFISQPEGKREQNNGVADGKGSTTNIEESSRQQASIPRWKSDRHVAVKDNIVTSDFPTTCASGILQKHQSPFEASAVEQLRSKRLDLVGKTNLDEFGMGSHSTNSFFGTVTNSKPFDHLSVGGSSGGSAVAVTGKMCVAALGTDTGGSVRLPAAYAGIFGFKPSYGIISRWGVVPYANSLDTVGIMARSGKKICRIFEKIQAHDPKDPTSLSEASRERALYPSILVSNRKERVVQTTLKDRLPNLRIGVPIEYNIAELDEKTRKAWQRTLILLEHQGCTIVPISLPNTINALPAYYVLAPAEAASNLSKYDGVRYGTRSKSSDGAGDVLYSKSRGEGFGDEVKKRILLGSFALSSGAMDNYFLKAQKVRRLVQRDFDRVFSLPNPLRDPEQFDLSDMDESIKLDDKMGPSQVDLIVCPTAPTFAPELDTIATRSEVYNYIDDIFTVPASLAGLPAINIPVKRPEEEGRGVAGLQIIGQYGDDNSVLYLANKLANLLLGGKEKRSVKIRHVKTQLLFRKV